MHALNSGKFKYGNRPLTWRSTMYGYYAIACIKIEKFYHNMIMIVHVRIHVFPTSTEIATYVLDYS